MVRSCYWSQPRNPPIFTCRRRGPSVIGLTDEVVIDGTSRKGDVPVLIRLTPFE
jgi:hypothetical protein